MGKSVRNVSGAKPSDAISGKSITRILRKGALFSPRAIYIAWKTIALCRRNVLLAGGASTYSGRMLPSLRESLPSETDNPTWRNSRSGALCVGSICLPSCASQARRKQHYAVKDGTLQWCSAIVDRQMPNQAQACKGSNSVLASSQHPALLILAVFESVLNACLSVNA